VRAFTLGRGFCKVSCISRAALPETFKPAWPLRRRPRYTCERFGMRGRPAYGPVSSHQASRAIQCTHTSRYMFRIRSPEGVVLCKRFGSRRSCSCRLRRHLGMLPNSRCSVLKCSAFRQARFQSTSLHFYQNRQLELYAAKEAQRLSLRQLVHDSY
jgi:hypothetical protein